MIHLHPDLITHREFIYDHRSGPDDVFIPVLLLNDTHDRQGVTNDADDDPNEDSTEEENEEYNRTHPIDRD